MRKVKGQEGAKVIWVESAKGRWQGGMEAPGQGAARLTSGRWTTRAALEQQRAHALKLAEQFNAASQKAVDASNKPQFRNLSDLSPQEWSDIGNMVENFEIVGDFVAVYRRPGDVTSYIGFLPLVSYLKVFKRAVDVVKGGSKVLNQEGGEKLLRGTERASRDLLDAVARRDRLIDFARGKDLELMEKTKINAYVGGEKFERITLRPDARKIELLEEYLHGAQNHEKFLKEAGGDAYLAVLLSEIHVKSFMIRHQKMLGIISEDVKVLEGMLQRHYDTLSREILRAPNR